MNELRDRLQELADGYARAAEARGPGAARRRGRRRRRRAVAGVVLAGLLAVAGGVGLLPALRAPRPAEPVTPPPTPAPVPRSTAWFRPTHVPDGFRPTGEREWLVERLGPPIPGVQAFRLVKGNGEFAVSVHPDLRQLDVAREARTYPTVRVVRVRGHDGLLFPYRPSNFYNGLIWEERPGVVVQVLGSQGVRDRMLLNVAEGLRIVQPVGGQVAITVGPRPPGWIRVGQGTRWPTSGDYLAVLPRRHIRTFHKGPGEHPFLVVSETRDRFGPLRPEDRPKRLPAVRRTWVRVHGHPALLDDDPVNRVLTVTWREPGGIELVVEADERLGRDELLAVAEGLRQP
jgi:hypothetical protein